MITQADLTRSYTVTRNESTVERTGADLILRADRLGYDVHLDGGDMVDVLGHIVDCNPGTLIRVA